MNLSKFAKHETHKLAWGRFLLALAVFIIYVVYLVIRYDTDGLVVGLITWSAFVLATPIADAGLLLDFPMRLITGIRMMTSEIIVWTVAISLNVYLLSFRPHYYSVTYITQAFHDILVKPWPNWIIICVSAGGTFLSLYFGDELLDVISHDQRKKYKRHKGIYRFIIALFLILLFYYFYRKFLHVFGINI